jgi:hypothetical protein
MQQETPRVGVLRIFRVEEGTTVHARVLSEGYRGIFTHYARGRSVYCQGDKCEATLHKLDRVWKGYAAVELWNVATKKWNPVVLEISEALELDLRGFWKRGQVWEFYRDLPTKKKSMPIMGKLLEERDPLAMPPEFDFKPVLLHLYHVQSIRLDCLNPMPPRVMVTESDGAGPTILDPIRDAQTAAVDPEKEAEFRKRFNLDRKSPTERKKK